MSIKTFYIDNAKNEWYVGKQFYVDGQLLVVIKVGVHQFKCKPV